MCHLTIYIPDPEILTNQMEEFDNFLITFQSRRGATSKDSSTIVGGIRSSLACMEWPVDRGQPTLISLSGGDVD